MIVDVVFEHFELTRIELKREFHRRL
jgi:hypothetical protein